MEDFEARLERAERLSVITQKIGYALWQIQELEGACATYYVLVEQAVVGMGEETGRPLEEKAKRKTFGATIHKMVEAGLLDVGIESRFKKLLSERNWLVHGSRESSRNAIHHEERAIELLERMQAIADEALALLKHVGALAGAYVKQNGFSDEDTEAHSTEILKQWHSVQIP